MIGMQYKINLPSDYDMDIIRERVKNNGYKTDNFHSLKFKFYMITEKNINGNLQNSYAPLYLWKNHSGMNKFLFEGFYDNILESFGWQHINTGIPLFYDFSDEIKKSKYVFEFIHTIKPQRSLTSVKDRLLAEFADSGSHLGILTLYNPDTWVFSIYLFTDKVDRLHLEKGNYYEILHISNDGKKADAYL
jgi:hypothetical protein